jgi:Ca2+-binding RTX toxin-like protein
VNRFIAGGLPVEMHGGTGNDTVWGEEGRDALYGDEGNDHENATYTAAAIKKSACGMAKQKTRIQQSR